MRLGYAFLVFPHADAELSDNLDAVVSIQLDAGFLGVLNRLVHLRARAVFQSTVPAAHVLSFLVSYSALINIWPSTTRFCRHRLPALRMF
jgi:hypothetical protein